MSAPPPLGDGWHPGGPAALLLTQKGGGGGGGGGVKGGAGAKDGGVKGGGGGAKGAKLAALNEKAAKGDKGGPIGGEAAKCAWTLRVDVTSLDPHWPAKSVKVALYPPGPAADRKAALDTKALLMTAKKSPSALFEGKEPAEIDVTAKFEEPGWMLVSADAKPLPEDAVRMKLGDHDKKHLPLRIRQPLWVYLDLLLKDPEGKAEYTFPPDLAVTVAFPNKKTQDEKVAKEGRLKFEVPRTQKSFTLVFGDGKALHYVASKSAKETATTLATKKEIADLRAAAQRFFSLPPKWSLVESIWDVKGADTWDAKKGVFGTGEKGKQPESIGTEKAPVRMLLDPHWQFVRFEFFDRYYGHTDHADKAVPVPALLFEGYRTTGKIPPLPHTSADWPLYADDAAKAVLCLPWIVQKTGKGKADARPDKNIQLRFTTAPKTFVVSASKTERKVEEVADAAKLKASADRLKYYDLPEVWRSKGFWVRFADGKGRFFEDMASKEPKRIDDSKAPDKPLAFSLDDIVLTGTDGIQIALAKDDDVAIFYHKLNATLAGGGASTVGVYKFDQANKKSFRSAVDRKNKNYLADYPHWVRAVIARGSLFDVFAGRTKDSEKNAVIGARAGVRWVDLVGAGAPAGKALTPRPARKDFDFYSVQPAFEQQFNSTVRLYKGPGSTPQGIGRYDMILLRCCDRDGDTEVAANLQYFRMLYNFKGAGKKGTPPTPYHKPNAAWKANRAQYVEDAGVNMAARWSGNDAMNAVRTQLVPQDAKHKLRADVITFIQPVPTAKTAHFRLDVVREGMGALGGRAWMAGDTGIGELGEGHSVPDGAFAPGSFTAAHELGHGGSLPDEYNERWGAFSENELSFRNNVPGDPYEPDGRSWDPGVPNAGSDHAMMTGVVVMRNRYFWHAAEFLRAATGVPFFVKYDTYPDYKVPPHPNFPTRSYTYWPIAESVGWVPGGRGKTDLMLYAMGKERYTKDILAKGPFEGILVVQVRMLLTHPTLKSAMVVPILRRRVMSLWNDKFYAKGKVHVGTTREWEFTKALVRFSPRLMISKDVGQDATGAWVARDNTGDGMYKWLVAQIPAHFNVATQVAKPAVAKWTAKAPDNNLVLDIDASKPNWKAVLESGFGERFAEMLGFADVKSVDAKGLKAFALQVITTGADVADL